MRRIALLVVVAAALAAWAAMASGKPLKPVVVPAPARNIQTTSATLAGSVNPKGSATTYMFDYGTTPSYGTRTDPAAAGAGTTAVQVTAPVSGLTPDTLYHYRLVASNAAGTTLGHDRTFITRDAPVVITLQATPSPVPFGSGTTITGRAMGPTGGNRAVVLTRRSYPYAGGFQQAGSETTTDDQGNFAFPAAPMNANTQFRVVTTDKKVMSPVLLVHSQVRVRLSISRSHVKRGGRVRFSGTVRPAEDSTPFLIQHLTSKGWRALILSTVRPLSASSSRFSKRLRIMHSGRYRVLVRVADGAHVSGASRTRRITVVP